MKKTLEDFTPEIRAKIPEYQKKCLNGIVNNAEFPIENTVKYVHKIYELAGFDKPMVIQLNGPLEYRFMFDVLQKKSLNTSLNTSLDASLRASLDTSLNTSLDASLRASLGDSLVDSLNTSLNTSLHASLNTSLDASLDASLRASLDASLDASLLDSLNTSLDASLRASLDTSLNTSLRASLNTSLDASENRSNWSWFCSIYSRVYMTWFKFIQDEFKIDHPKKNDLNELYSLIINSNISRCFFAKKLVLVLKTPKKVKLSNDKLHSVDGPSYSYIGFKKYHIRGVEITRSLFEKLSKKEYVFEDFVNEKNEEIKNATLAFMEEKHGSEYLFRFLSENLKEVDSHTEKKDPKYLKWTTKGVNIGVYTLFKGEVNYVDIAFVRCYCPSTDRMFFLGVDPVNNNAKDAIASLYRVPRKLREEIKYIQRQGERFTTFFKDKSALENLNEKEANDLVGISGNEYFELMKYEF